MASIRWLHLTDLHQGMEAQRSLMPGVRKQLSDDLKRLSDVAGPWDLVLFTGDLTQTGAASEFDALTVTLERLWEQLASIGSRPVLLAVPGNHDLRRPPPSPMGWALRHWHEEQGVQQEFWRDRDNDFRRQIDTVFSTYTAWWSTWNRAHEPPPDISMTIRHGALPGDFSASIEKEGLRVGVVGLNSAFFQLTADDYKSKLHVDPRQFHAVCGDDGPAWIETHQYNLLLTHHPPEWLHPESRSLFLSEIAHPEWFDAHLYGHMHEPTAEFRQIAGAPAVRRLQGASLFGLETWGDGRQSRIHGYSAGRIALENGAGRLSVWPRNAIVVQSGYRKLVADQTFDLDRDEAFHSPLQGRPSRIRTKSIPPPSGAVTLQDPGGPYERRWYVPDSFGPVEAQDPRTVAAQATLARLRQPGQPIALWAPTLFGKTWFLQYVLQWLGENDPDYRIVRINLRLFGADALRSLPAFLRQLAELVAAQLDLDASLAAAMEARAGTPLLNFSWLFSAHALRQVRGPLVLAIDQADELLQCSFRDDFFGLLRSWSDQANMEPWSRIRLVVAMSATPTLMTSTPARSPFPNRTFQIRLTDLDREQVEELARLHGLVWGPAQIQELMALVSGHPFLIRLAMVSAARHQIPLSKLLHESSQIFEPFLDAVRWRLANDPGLRRAFREMIAEPNNTVEPTAYLRLRDAGLVQQVNGVYQLRYPLYNRLIHARNAQ
jgi:hypothetical protein